MAEKFEVELRIRIDWSELDYFGHVNNVSFFKYIQAARVNYWDQTGISFTHLQTKIGPMLASCKCDFKLPLFYPGEVKIQSRTEFIGNSSFGFVHQLYNEKGECVAEARDVMVMFDFNLNTKVDFPDELRARFESLAGKTFPKPA